MKCNQQENVQPVNSLVFNYQDSTICYRQQLDNEV